MKLGKVEQQLLDHARSRGGRYAVETGSGRGARGGRISYGKRDVAALHRLASRGLVEVTSREADVWWTGNGHQVRGSIICFRLVDG